MKRVLAIFVLFLLLTGCENRNLPYENSSSQEETAPQTPLEEILDEQLKSLQETGTDPDMLTKLGIFIQAGPASVLTETEYQFPLTIQKEGGESQVLDLTSSYRLDENYQGDPQTMGTNIDVMGCGTLAIDEEHLLLLTTHEAMVVSVKNPQEEPLVLHSYASDENWIVHGGYDPQAGYLLLLADGQNNRIVRYDTQGKLLSDTLLEKEDESDYLSPYIRLSRVNPCQAEPLGNVAYLSFGEPKWMIPKSYGDYFLWREGSGQKEPWRVEVSSEQDGKHFAFYRISQNAQPASGKEQSGIAWLLEDGEQKAFYFDASVVHASAVSQELYPDVDVQIHEDSKVTILSPSVPMEIQLDFSASSAQILYHYTQADLLSENLVCQSPSKNKSVYAVSSQGMGDAIWGNLVVADDGTGEVSFLCTYAGASDARFFGENLVVVHSTAKLEAYDLQSRQPLEEGFQLPDGRWALQIRSDETNGLFLVLCRESGYDFADGEKTPLSLLVYNRQGELVEDIATQIKVPPIRHNYPYAPSVQLEQGVLQVYDMNHQLLGEIPYLH